MQKSQNEGCKKCNRFSFPSYGWVFVYVYDRVHLKGSVCISFCVCFSLCMFLSVYVSFCVCFFLCTFLSVYVSFCVLFFLCMRMIECVYLCMFIYMFQCMCVIEWLCVREYGIVYSLWPRIVLANRQILCPAKYSRIFSGKEVKVEIK